METGRKLTEAEMRVLEMSDYGNGRKAIAADDVPSRNGRDLWGGVIPGRRIWKAMEDADLVLLPEEDPVILEDGREFTFTAFYEITDRGRLALKSGIMPPIDCSS